MSMQKEVRCDHAPTFCSSPNLKWGKVFRILCMHFDHLKVIYDAILVRKILLVIFHGMK